MTQSSAITNEMRAMIGTTSEPNILEVERGAIRRYADAIEDSNPLFRDVEHAKNSRCGEIICPPGFFGWPVKGDRRMGLMANAQEAAAKAGFPRLLDAGIEYEFFLPIRAGDTLTTYARLADITEREGKSGKMILFTTETIYLNQNGDTVAKARGTMIYR
jgi:acyl dehydratase